jgi:hypothetical protein
MTKEDQTKELDTLFNRIDNSPWRDRQKVNNVPTDGTAFQHIVGMEQIYEDMQTIGSTPGGLANGYFENGPADDTVDLDDEDNPLPSWDMTAAQGTWEVSWSADANAPSGYAIDFTQASAGASDEVYLEQIIPVASYRRFITTVRHSADNANMGMKVAVAFLDETESVIGSELSNTWSITTEQTSRFWREPPALAFYVRVRVGFVNAAGTTGQTGTLLFVTTEDPTIYGAEVTGVKSYVSPSAGTDYAMPYPSDLIPNGVYKAVLQGFVVGIEAKTDDTISAGNGTVRVENDTQATTPGPSVTLSSGTTAARAVQSLDGKASYDFATGDELHLELSADGSFASTGDADWYGSALLLLVVHDTGDW